MAELKTVLATNPLHPEGQAMLAGKVRLVTAPDTRFETLNALAADVHGIVVRAQLPDDICDHGLKLEGLVRHGVGLDFIPVEAATRKGVAVANLPGCNTQTVVEYVFAQLLNLRRPLVMVDGALRERGWDEARGLANNFGELGGTTLGIVGVGTIGSRIATIATAVGIKVIGVSRPQDPIPVGVERVSVDELFARADAVVLSCALTPETRGIANAARIASMKPTAILVNASRGPVLDTAALVEALQQRRIAGAALDVYDSHPLPPSHPLFACPNLLMTPHIAAITATSFRAMSVGACAEMLRILDGEEPNNLVNPDYRKYKAQS
jgi:D-3-phosphoglycerate dehydrogenase / 2-oxoglutarate reductase